MCPLNPSWEGCGFAEPISLQHPHGAEYGTPQEDGDGQVPAAHPASDYREPPSMRPPKGNSDENMEGGGRHAALHYSSPRTRYSRPATTPDSRSGMATGPK